LKVVEVELKSRKEAEKFLAPEWFGAEITEDENYKNANLATRKKTK